ncbi:MAG: hypothetical protein Q8Q31_01410 [Nanoarchaeota archaeon]|nr:hypothetical protein [Nanoarchaeota archaeon]
MAAENVGQVDLSGISYFLPLLSFLLVFVVIFAILQKTKIFENKWLQLFISFLFSTIFVSFVGARDYVINVIPWFAVMVVCLFLILFLISFVGKPLEGWNKGIGIMFVVALILVFLISALFVFSSFIGPYLPGGDRTNVNPDIVNFVGWAYSSRVAGGFFLLIISALVSWVLVKMK